MPAKKKKQLKSVNVTGRKKVLIISVLALVAIGVVVLAKSFAATMNFTYTVNSGTLRAGAGTSTKTEGTAKGSPQVLVMNKSGVATIESSSGIPIPRGQAALFCVTTAYFGSPQYAYGIQLTMPTSGGSTYGATISLPRDKPAGYTEYCSDQNAAFQFKDSEKLGPIRLYNGSSTAINISAATIKYIDAPAPAPAPSK